MRFKIDAKEFKKLHEKAKLIIRKKNGYDIWSSIFFEVKRGVLYMMAADYDCHVKLISKNVSETKAGQIAVNAEKMDVITGLSGELVFQTEKEKDNGIPFLVVSDAKRKFRIKCMYYTSDEEEYFKEEKEADEDSAVFAFRESWLHSTITTMMPFSNAMESNIGCFVFDSENKRIVTLDGVEMAIRKFKDEDIRKNGTQNIRVLNKGIGILKNLIDKYGNSIIEISSKNEDVIIKGENFSFYINKVMGKRYDLNQTIESFTNKEKALIQGKVKTKELVESLSFAQKILKGYRKAVIWGFSKKNILLYANNSSIEMREEINVEYEKYEEQVITSYNPSHILNIFKSLNTDEPLFLVQKKTGEACIMGNDFFFILCPVIINPEDRERIKKMLENK